MGPNYIDQHLLHLIKDLKHEDTFEVLMLTLVKRVRFVNLGGEGEVVDWEVWKVRSLTLVVRVLMLTLVNRGLIPILSELLPNAEKRMCARHIWSNWHAYFEVKVGEEVHAMSKLGKKEITEDLLHHDPRNWSRAFFQTHSKCDVVENNMCETFNSWILAARINQLLPC
ncbi:hypothetical protein H5410_006903 [Solanum commersonii]|uniref:Uncharacterized protein n=1 Tax=Solanum commersonii TaxID=4109 RepID=A0A9J6AAL7_SOLCO|nr:hypothetical protein H5410_006903 [Solanum commersonii]